MVAGDVGDDRGFVVGQPEDLRCGEEVLRVFVMRAQVDVDADVVQQRRDLRAAAVRDRQAVLVGKSSNRRVGEHGDVPAVRLVDAVCWPSASALGQDLALEVLGAQPAARIGKIEQHAGAQRRVGDDDLLGRGFRESER